MSAPSMKRGLPSTASAAAATTRQASSKSDSSADGNTSRSSISGLSQQRPTTQELQPTLEGAESDTFFSALPNLHHDPDPDLTVALASKSSAAPGRPESGTIGSGEPNGDAGLDMERSASEGFGSAAMQIGSSSRHPLRTVSTVGEDSSAVDCEEEEDEETDDLPYLKSDIVVISGGSGYNNLVAATPSATFIMPVSDNGGSSSEIIRVLGGPSIGDLRSRLVRLIPLPPSSPPATDASIAENVPTAVLSKTPTMHHTSSMRDPSRNRPSASTASARQQQIQTSHVPPSNRALHALLSYRLPTTGSARDVKQEWLDILEGKHKLWRGIEHERKECVRGFLVHFESEILRRAHRNFNFRGGSIGNFFLAAGQKFFRSIQSAIFLFSAVTLINGAGVGMGPAGRAGWVGGAKVIPVINTNHTATIAAELRNGEIIVGQCEISHPAEPTQAASAQPQRPRSLHQRQSTFSTHAPGTPSSVIFDPFLSLNLNSSSGDIISGTGTPALAVGGSSVHQAVKERARSMHTVGNTGDGLDTDDIDIGQSHVDPFDPAAEESGAAAESTGNIVFSKADEEDPEPSLPSPIERIFYVNAYRNEISPAPNPSFIDSLSTASTLLFSCGSLWTSIIPCIALRGVATAVARSPTLKHKVLLLNSSTDRETHGMTALDFVSAIVSSLNSTDGGAVKPPPQTGSGTASEEEEEMHHHVWTDFGGLGYAARDLVTCVVCVEGGLVPVEKEEIEDLGIEVIQVKGKKKGGKGAPLFTEQAVKSILTKLHSRG